MSNSFFEKRIKPILQYIGTIGAAIMMVAYVIIVIVMINGFDPSDAATMELNIVFAIVTGLLGFVIMQFLKIQGIAFAKEIEANKEVMEQYFETQIKKEKKLHSLKYFWTTTMLKDFLIRCITLILSSISIVWIVIQGSKDWNLMLLAIVNLLMFICFGLLNLVKAYDFYNENHINFIKQKIAEAQASKNKGEKENA